MRFSVHPLFFVVVGFSLLFGLGAFVIALVIVVLVHELSHLLVAAHYGVRAEKLRLLPFGAELQIDSSNLEKREKIIIYLAGPIGNIVFALIASGFLWLTPQYFTFLEYVIIASFFPAVLNLLPIYPLDGGKILKLLGKSKFQFFVKMISNLAAVALLIIGIFVMFNPPLILFAATIILTVNFERRESNFISYERLFISALSLQTGEIHHQECSSRNQPEAEHKPRKGRVRN